MSNQNPPQNDLPDWLRGDGDSDWEQTPDEPATPAKRPSAETPPAPDEDDGELPPWLAEERDEDAQPVVDASGKLSKDFLAKADQLVDRVESELTYDQWIALQREAGRARDIEEEIPDLLSDAAPVDPTALSDTGQLPDWFLGLEELDTSDAPEWFTGESTPGTSTLPETEGDIPPWLAGMEEPAPRPPTKSIIPDELPPLEDDPLADLFGEAAPPPQDAPPARRLKTDWLSGLEMDEPEELPDESAFADELPSEDWLTGIGSRAPDQFQTMMLPERDAEPPSETFEISELPGLSEPEVAPLDARAEAWLNELEGIVGFTQQLDASEEEPFVQPDASDIDWGFDATPKADTSAAFDWEAAEAAPEQPAPEEEDRFDWLNAAASYEEEAPPEPEPSEPAPDKPIMLTGMLSRFRQPEPPPPVEDEEDEFEPPQMPDFDFEMVDDLPKTNPFGDVEHELRRDPSEPEHMDWESVVRSQALPDSYFELLSDEEKQQESASVAAPLFDVSEEELESSWLAEQLLSEVSSLEASSEVVEIPEFEPTGEALDELPEFNLDLNALDAIPPDLDNIEYNLNLDQLPDEPPPDTNALAEEEPLADLPDFDYLTNPAPEAAQTVENDEALPDFAGFVGAPPPVNDDLPFTDDLPEEEQAEPVLEDDMGWLRDELFAEEAELADDEQPDLAWKQMQAELADDEQPDLAWEQPQAELADDEQPDLAWGQPQAELADDEQPDLAWGQPQAELADDELPDINWGQAEWGQTTDELPDLEQAAAPSERWALDDEDEELSPWDAPPEIPADDLLEDEENPLGFLDEPIDAFRDFDQSPARVESLTNAPDWLANLEPGDAQPPAEGESRRPFVMPLEIGREIIPEADNIENLDSYLASLTADEIPLRPETGRMLERTDVDELLEEPLLPDLPERTPAFTTEEAPTLLGAEWLEELQATVSDVSAGAIVRQRKDRPVEELPERLQKLRAKGEKIAEETPAASDPLAPLLPSAADALAPAPIKPGVPTFDQPASLTPEQQRKAELLGSLAATDMPARPTRMSAIEMTYDSPYFTGLQETESSVIVEKQEQPRPAPRRKARTRTRVRLPIDRWLIALALGLAVLLPFVVPALRIGDLPPAQFPAGGRAATAFDRIDSLRRGEVALVGIEYGSSAAAEMDGLTDALLRHILLRGAYPVLVGGNPIGLLRAGNLIDSINADAEFLDQINLAGGLQANRDYYLVRYLPGGALGLRAFSEDTAALLLTDINGQATGLRLRTLQDFSLIAVIADNAEDVRTYAEQIAPLARQSLLAAVSYSAAPLVEPFLGSGFTNAPPTLDGLLVGYADSYTYSQMLAGVSAAARTGRQVAPVLVGPEPTPMPTQQPAAPVAAEATPEATAEATAEATTEAGEPIPQAEASATATPRGGQTQMGVIRSSGSVNVRSGPGTGNPIITALRPGTQVAIIGQNEAGDWLNVRLEDGTEGWVSAQLVQVEPQSSALGKGWAKIRAPLAQPIPNTPRPTRTPPPTEDANASPTPEATARPTRTLAPTETLADEEAAADESAADESATDEAGGALAITPTPVPAIPVPPPSPGYRDERWYGMTLGILVSAFIIAFGALLNIVRGLLRRR